MKKNKKLLIFVVSIVLVLALGVFIFYKFIYDANSLNLKEKQWIENNSNNLISINTANNVNIFSYNGTGVYNDFLEDFAAEYGIQLNKNNVDARNNIDLGLTITNDEKNDALLLYQDHYVIISKNDEYLKKVTDLNAKKFGVLINDLSYLSNHYFLTASITSYENGDSLINALNDGTIEYAVVPRNDFLPSILSNGFNIAFHISDMSINYYLNLGSESTLNSIITKYYNIWMKEKYEDSYYINLYNLFVEKIGLSQIETDDLTNRTYKFGFADTTPYSSLNGSNYGGVVFSYLEEFSKFANVDFTYIKYKTDDKLVNAYNNENIDLVFTNSSLPINEKSISSNLIYEYCVIDSYSNDYNISRLNQITREIYVVQNTKLSRYISEQGIINVKFVSDEKKLISAYKKGNLIVLDRLTYNNFVNKKINNSKVIFSDYTDNYTFNYKSGSDAFYKLFINYIDYLDNNKMVNLGLVSYDKSEVTGSLITVVAKYFLIIVSIGIAVFGIILASKKSVKLNTKIKKDEKLKFIDMLTSLKNRNYLNEKMGVWNQNTIYPQAIIITDLNNVKYLNDTFGHEEGDKQIKAAANILIKTQLDNTEIMRTDGNEFMIYLVGYNEKQVINYIKKLLKEFKDLPYDYGSAFGFSMIVDDLKLLDDAINEATIQMRNNKETVEDSNDKKES